MLRCLLFAGLFVVTASCDSSDFSVLDNKIVVELTLVANEPVPQARVSELASTKQGNTFEDVAVTDAEVILSTGDINLFLEPSVKSPGIYEYLGDEHIIQPGARYDIRVAVPGISTPIKGTTNIPTPVKILSASRESGTYLSDEQLVLKVIPGRSSDQPQSNFTLVTEALDVLESTAVPVVTGFVEDDDDLSLEDYRISGSPIITEGVFVRFPDGAIELVYPWIGVSFYGRNIVYVNALDDNLAGFIRSAEQQQGGDGAFGPGVIPNAIPSLSGAHGVFGSVARDSVRFTVFPPEDE